MLKLSYPKNIFCRNRHTEITITAKNFWGNRYALSFFVYRTPAQLNNIFSYEFLAAWNFSIHFLLQISYCKGCFFIRCHTARSVFLPGIKFYFLTKDSFLVYTTETVESNFFWSDRFEEKNLVAYFLAYRQVLFWSP